MDLIIPVAAETARPIPATATMAFPLAIPPAVVAVAPIIESAVVTPLIAFCELAFLVS